MKITIKISFFGESISGSFKVLGVIEKNEIVKTGENEFEALMAHYINEYEIDEEIEKSSLFTIWLAPKIGIVKIEGCVVGSLIDYQLTPLPQKVASNGKISTSWAKLKQLR